MADLGNTCFWFPELPECNPTDDTVEPSNKPEPKPVDKVETVTEITIEEGIYPVLG